MEDLLLEHMGKGFILMLMISMPCVLMAAGVGLVVGILQAVTQVQEQTIAAAPKIFAVFLVLLIGGGTFTNMLVGYFRESSHMAFQVVTKQDDFALMPDQSLAGTAQEPNKLNDDFANAANQPPKDFKHRANKNQKVINTRGMNAPQPSIAESQYINRKRHK